MILAQLMILTMISSCTDLEESNFTFEMTIPQQGIYTGTYTEGENIRSAGITFTHASNINELFGNRKGNVSIGNEEGSLVWISDRKIVTLSSSLSFLNGEWFLTDYSSDSFQLMKGTGAKDAPNAILDMKRKN